VGVLCKGESRRGGRRCGVDNHTTCPLADMGVSDQAGHVDLEVRVIKMPSGGVHPNTTPKDATHCSPLFSLQAQGSASERSQICRPS
jgi:hypothetical protein